MLPALVLAAVFSRSALPATPSAELLATVTVGGVCDGGNGACRPGTLVIGAGEIVGHRPDGTMLVVTARHVVENISRPRVYLQADHESGTSFTSIWQSRGRVARIVEIASDADLALVSFRPTTYDAFAVATLAADDRPGDGDVIGDPNGALWTTSPFAFVERSDDTYVVDCATCGPGDSGGGVFNDRGRLAGILIRQRVDPTRIVNGEPVGTTQFQVVSLAKVRSLIAGDAEPKPPPAAPIANRAPRETDAWARFEAMRRGRTFR
jgi:hypothetical protein